MRSDWELCDWGDGSVRLCYWDARTGDDVVLILHPTGLVLRATYDSREQEIREVVENFPRLLIEQNLKLKAQAAAEEEKR